MRRIALSMFVCSIVVLSSTLCFAESGSAVEDMKGNRSSEQIKWEQNLDKRSLNNPAFAFVKDDPKLPRVLLIGDSISIGYTPYVREMLESKANVHRVPENGGDTAKGLESLDKWLGEGKWDLIHFNWGLHDLKRLSDGKLDLSADQVRPVKDYAKNLEQLVSRLKATGAKLIWATTTPVPDGSSGRIKGDEVVFNKAAKKVMKKHKVKINDLYALIYPDLDKYQRPKNVHFLPEGSECLAKKVVEEISKALKIGR